MFEGAFSFRGRVGRLRYFLTGLLMMVLAMAGAAALALAMMEMRHSAVGMLLPIALALAGLVALLWFDLSLHVRRINDIGWDAWVVIPGWIAVGVADVVLAKLVPALAIGHQHYGTPIGALFNLGLSLALLFWPGCGPDETPNARAARVFDASAPPVRPRPVPRPGATPSFGRRGLR